MAAGLFYGSSDPVTWAVLARALDALERERRRDGERLPAEGVNASSELKALLANRSTAAAKKVKAEEVGSRGSAAKPEIVMVSSKQAAQLLKCGDRNVRDLAHRKKIPAVRHGHHWAFDVADLEDYRARRS